MYGGIQLALLTAMAVLEILTEDGLLEQGVLLEERMLARFNEMQKRHKIIGEVRGKGHY